MENPSGLEPRLTPAERDELGHIGYFLERWQDLRARGLIPDDVSAQVASELNARRNEIEQVGRYHAAIAQAEKLLLINELDAIAWTRRAAELDPSRDEPWVLRIELLRRSGQHEQAIAVCAEAAERFPEMQGRLVRLREEHERLEADRQQKATIAEQLASAQKSLDQERDRDAIAFCAEVLAISSNSEQAMAIKAFGHQRLGEFDEALALYEQLRRLQPANLVWRQWIRNVTERQQARRVAPAAKPALSVSEPSHEPEPQLSWASIAGEFLQDHWQKLILCLAVLLIVVSTNVGAYQVLGPVLWSRLGKCALALVYTAMFAGFGAGLLRWGAERTGRMMLITTLIVVPADFMLAGQMHLLLRPTPGSLALLTIDAVALFLLVRAIVSRLGLRHGTFLSLALLALSAMNATTARIVGFAWGYTALVLSGLLFLASVWWINTRRREGEPGDQREFLYSAFGLLVFAFLSGELRTGLYVLPPRMHPCLFAIPAMLTAIAGVLTAHRLMELEEDPRRASSIRFSAFVLAGLAFALALSRPPIPSPLLSGNTLATALLGLALFTSSLRAYRQPPYLYFSFAALFVAYFGGLYFMVDLVRAVEGELQRLLGYRDHLPSPFKAINGLGFNALLGLLAIFFARRWKDERLARHCHFIALPFSIAACVFSGFEPKAAVICLAGYTALYALAVWIFEAPALSYLACAALAAATYFASTLIPSTTLATQALGAAVLGLLYWSVQATLHACGVRHAYRSPLYLAALAVSMAAMIGGMAACWPAPPVSTTLPWTFGLAALVCILVHVEEPTAALAYLAALNANVAYALWVVYAGARWGWHPPYAMHAVVASASALALAWLAAGLGWLADRGRCRGPLAAGLFPIALAQLALGGMLCLSQVPPFWPWYGSPLELTWLSLALILGSAALATVTAFGFRTKLLAYCTVAAGVAGIAAGVLAGLVILETGPLATAMAIALGMLALLLYETWKFLERTPAGVLFRGPILHTALVIVAPTLTLCPQDLNYSWGGANKPLVALAFGLAAATLALSTREFPFRWLAHLALAHAMVVWFCLIQTAVEGARITLTYSLETVVFALGLLAIDEALVAHVRNRGPRDPEFAGEPAIRARVFSRALPGFAIAVTLFATLLAVGPLRTDANVVATLFLAALAILWATRYRRHGLLVYAAIGHAVAALFYQSVWWVGWGDAGVTVGSLALTAALSAGLLVIVGMIGRRRRWPTLYTVPCLVVATILCAIGFVMAIDGRVESRAAFTVCAAALLVNVGVCIAIAIAEASAVFTIGGLLSFVVAVYLTLLSVGQRDPAMAYVLGLAAVVQALLFWTIGFVCRGLLTARWERVFARPLFAAAIVLTVLAVPVAHTSALTMALVALSFLLAIKSEPRTEWLYPAVAAAGWSVYDAWLIHLGRESLVAAVVASAYVLWALGVLVRHAKPRLCKRLRIERRAYEFPLFNAAILGAALAACLRIDESLTRGIAWTAGAGWPALLGLFCLLMLTAYPHRGWVHAAIAFVNLSIVMAIAPHLTTPVLWLLVAMGLANAWYIALRGGSAVERTLCERFAIEGHGYVDVIGHWSITLFLASAALASGLVVEMTLTEAFQLTPLVDLAAIGGWSSVLLALLLGGIYAAVALPRLVQDQVAISVSLVLTLIVWWLGTSISPLVMRLGVSQAIYLPLATAIVALTMSLLAELGPWRAKHWMSFGVTLALVAAAFTRGAVDLATVGTLLLTAGAFGVLLLSRDRNAAAAGSSVAWSMACLVFALVVARWLGFDADLEQMVTAGAGAVAALFGLWAAAGRLRRLRPLSALTIERVAVVCSLLAFGLIVQSRIGPGPLRDAGALLGVGLLLALALFDVLMAGRWRAEWLVYAAQGTLLAAYFAYRTARPLTAATDAAVLTLFGYLDLGIAELMQRLRLKLYARPTLYVSLLMPLIPLAVAIHDGRLDDVNLFFLFTAATFYGVACFKMQWKTLGYAAAVLYNAFLWILWARAGYQLADHSQFYLVPVGFSAILFAEVNRRELGHQAVNAIRVVGLTLIYLSLAVPIWQFQSFGAWLTLLLLSLTGIFVGIGLRVQSFLWLGLVCFVLDVVYQLGRLGMENALAKWGIMLALGILLFLFVALNEKKRIVGTMRLYFDQVRQWE